LGCIIAASLIVEITHPLARFSIEKTYDKVDVLAFADLLFLLGEIGKL